MKRFIEGILGNKTAVIFITLTLLAMSIFVIFTLPEGVFPKANFPRILITADMGYTPLTDMEMSVTRPLENAVRTVEGVTIVRSTTSRGTADIDVFFNPKINLHQAYQLVNSKISEVRSELPSGVSIDITWETTSSFPMIGYSIYSDKRSLAELRTLAEYVIKPHLVGVKGIYKVVVLGGKIPEYWVVLKPEKLAAYKISPDDIKDALQSSNKVKFLGRISQEYKNRLGFAGKRLTNVNDIQNVVIRTRDGIPIYLKDVADVKSASMEQFVLTRSNWHPAVLFSIVRHPGANGVEVSKLVSQRLKKIKSSLPTDVKISKWYDLSDFVTKSIKTVAINLIIGIFLISFVVFLLLRSIKLSLPIIITMPLTLFFTFLGLRIFHLSINIMTLGGLTAALGILVANAIVVVENIERHRAEGERFNNALIFGTIEVIPPLLGATITTVIVFVPLIYLSGVSGMFFKPAALTLAIAIGISLLLAFSLTPLFTAGVLSSIKPARKKKIGRMQNVYVRWLGRSLSNLSIIPVITLIIVIGSIIGAMHLKTGFLPSWDEGSIVMDYKMPPGTSLEETNRVATKIEDILKTIPEVKAYSRRTGYELGGYPLPPNRGDFLINLIPHRKRSVFQIMDELRTKIHQNIPGVWVNPFQVLSEALEEASGEEAPIVVKIYGDNLSILEKVATTLRHKMQSIKGLTGVKLGVSKGAPEFNLDIYPEKAARVGLSPAKISREVKLALWGKVSTKIRKGLRLVGVRLKYPKSYYKHIEELNDLPIYSPYGVIPLSTVAKVGLKKGTYEVMHENGSLLITITGQAQEKDLENVIKGIKSILKRTPTPSGITISLGGDYKKEARSFKELMRALIIAIFLIFAVLILEFKYWKPSLAIFLGTIFSFSFVVFGLLVFHTPFDVSSFMGMIASLGIVVNNGILLIDFAERYKREGTGLIEAINKAGRVRFRPILITTITTLTGFLPMLISASILRPFAVAIISGLVGSLFFSLFVIPVLYYLFESKGR